MLRRYETIFIVRADLQSDEMSSRIDHYAEIITGMNGTIVKVENWGRRRLAYPIEKRREGVYIRIDFVAQFKAVSEVERNFKIDENVMRFQTVKLEDKVNMEEIEREIADALKKEEEQRKEEQKKEELKTEETVSKTADEEAETPEGPDSKNSETGNEDVAQDSVPVETDEEKAEEE